MSKANSESLSSSAPAEFWGKLNQGNWFGKGGDETNEANENRNNQQIGNEDVFGVWLVNGGQFQDYLQ